MPYANGSIHVGHLVEYIQTDIFVRFLRLIGKDVVYCCADDTHGTPIELKANELKIKPEELIAQVHKEHVRDFKSFHVKFDNYYSTNSKENKHFSDLIFNRLKEKGHIYTKEIEVTYCEHDKRTLPDRYVKGKCPKCKAEDQYGDVCENCNAAYKTIDLIDPYCILCKKKPTKRKSKHYFFRLSSFSGFLEDWINNNKNLQPEVKNFVLNWIKTGLEDWDVSRDGPYFGFNIPGEKDKYYYVWLDAPIGYIASYANLLGDIKKAEKTWNNSKIIHFIGKDIIYFHLLFWPAMLEGADFTLPEDIVVHGFLTVNGEKMSKSRGTFLTAGDFLQKYEPEYLRYYYASTLSKKLADINLDFKVFREKVNNELVANIGNFCYRVISFANKNFDGKITKKASGKYPGASVSYDDVSKNYRSLNFNEVVRSILLLSAHGNQVFQQEEPWKLIKSDKESVEALCYFCLDLVKNLSILISPILPELSKGIQSQLGLKELSWNDLEKQFEKYNLEKEKILVQKLEDAEKPVFPLNLKVARILEVKEHPDAEKLYVLQIDLGKEKRQLVAGLRQHYSKEQLLNKKIIVITNLKYAKLRGIESQGMLLAGDDGENVGVLTLKNTEPGSQAGIEGFENSNGQLSFEQFQKLSLIVKEGHPAFEGREIKTASESIKVEKVKDGARIK